MRKLLIVLLIIFVLAGAFYLAIRMLPRLAAEYVMERVSRDNPFVRGIKLDDVRFSSWQAVSFDGVSVYPQYPGSKPVLLDSLLMGNLWHGIWRTKWDGVCTGGGISFPVVASLKDEEGKRTFIVNISSPWFDLSKFAEHFLKPAFPAFRSFEYEGRAQFDFNAKTNFFGPPAAWLELNLDNACFQSQDIILSGCTASFVVPFSQEALGFIDSSKKGSMTIGEAYYDPYKITDISVEIDYSDTDYEISKVNFSCYEGTFNGEIEIVPERGRLNHRGSAKITDVALEVLARDVGGALENSTGVIEGALRWEGRNADISHAEGSFYVAKPGGRLKAGFLRSMINYLPGKQVRGELEKSLTEGDLFYFVEGKCDFRVDADSNQCEIRLDIEGETLHLKLTVEVPLDDLKALLGIGQYTSSALKAD